MWILTAPVPNSTIFEALILNALKAKNIDVSYVDRITIADKLGEHYSDIDTVRNQTIFYCDEFSFKNDDDQTVTIKLKLKFVEKCYDPTEYNALYGINAAQNALKAAGVFKNLSFIIDGAPTPRPMLFAKPNVQPTQALSAAAITSVLKEKKPVVQTYAKPTQSEGNSEDRTPTPTKSIDIPKPKTPGSGFFTPITQPVRLAREDSLDEFNEEYEVDGKPLDTESGRMTSTSSVAITPTPGDALDDVTEEPKSTASSLSLQFSMSW